MQLAMRRKPWQTAVKGTRTQVERPQQVLVVIVIAAHQLWAQPGPQLRALCRDAALHVRHSGRQGRVAQGSEVVRFRPHHAQPLAPVQQLRPVGGKVRGGPQAVQQPGSQAGAGCGGAVEKEGGQGPGQGRAMVALPAGQVAGVPRGRLRCGEAAPEWSRDAQADRAGVTCSQRCWPPTWTSVGTHSASRNGKPSRPC